MINSYADKVTGRFISQTPAERKTLTTTLTPTCLQWVWWQQLCSLMWFLMLPEPKVNQVRLKQIDIRVLLYLTSLSFLHLFSSTWFILHCLSSPSTSVSPPSLFANCSPIALTNTSCVSSSFISPVFFFYWPVQLSTPPKKFPLQCQKQTRGRLNVQIIREGGQEEGQKQNMTQSLWQINEGQWTALADSYCWEGEVRGKGVLKEKKTKNESEWEGGQSVAVEVRGE